MFFDRGGRHYYFAKYLAQDGYSPVVFCANTIHNKTETVDIGKSLYKEDAVDGIPFLFVKTSPYKGNGFSRIKNMLFFARNVMRTARILSKKERPDVIIASSVHPFTCVAGILTARKLKIPCIVEIRDLWPESIVAYQVVSKSNSLIWAMYQLEKWIYKKADKLIFTMEGGKEYIKEKGWGNAIDLNKVYHINNGIDLELFDYNMKAFPYRDDDLSDRSVFKAVYTGSIRRVNNLMKLVDAAAELERRGHNDIKILLWGNGDDTEAIRSAISENGLKSIIYKASVEKKYVPSIVSQADVNILHFDKTDIVRFGLSLNKMFEYLASGKAVLNDVKEPYDIIEPYCAGMTIEIQEPAAIADAIVTIKNWTNERKSYTGQNARKLAGNYDFKRLVRKLESIL
jgi:glycosyltransferase involved in cell wall biosynthesis